MNIDMNLVREILKTLYEAPTEEHPFKRESRPLIPFSLPGYENQSIIGEHADVIGEHVDLMVSCGLIERERIGMRPPPDSVGLKPTSEAGIWFDCALDDEKWAEGSAALEEKLKKGLSE
jgi:hypothetical protein